jgi:hypothetical protein
MDDMDPPQGKLSAADAAGDETGARVLARAPVKKG